MAFELHDVANILGNIFGKPSAKTPMEFKVGEGLTPAQTEIAARAVRTLDPYVKTPYNFNESAQLLKTKIASQLPGNIVAPRSIPTKTESRLALANIVAPTMGAVDAGMGIPYIEEGNLTTKVLKELEGKTRISKQYILDATNRGELKQAERDIIRKVADTMPDKFINVKEFADKVKDELLPLKVSNVGKSARYETITLPDELRGNVKNYRENIYESPIKTSAGLTHFTEKETPNYFGHTRIEDMADNKTRRVIEVQSDLYQKGNLEKQLRTADLADKANVKGYPKPEELAKLQRYNDPTAHFRMVREEIKQAAQDGKTKLQFPTGETAMRIEGLGDQDNWFYDSINGRLDVPLTPDKLKVGMKVGDPREETSYIITDVLGDGKFKAVSSNKLFTKADYLSKDLGYKEFGNKVYKNTDAEQFDISGKVDTENPIYKFYNKELQNYLKKFGGKTIVDKKGISWIEVPLKKKQGKLPVEAFALAPLAIPITNKKKDVVR